MSSKAQVYSKAGEGRGGKHTHQTGIALAAQPATSISRVGRRKTLDMKLTCTSTCPHTTHTHATQHTSTPASFLRRGPVADCSGRLLCQHRKWRREKFIHGPNRRSDYGNAVVKIQQLSINWFLREHLSPLLISVPDKALEESHE